MEPIPVIVIATPHQNRHTKLVEILGASKIFKVIIQEACMYSRNLEEIDVDERVHETIYGRNLLDGEIGCSISHNRARHVLALSDFGGVILEDDARVPNLKSLEEHVESFLTENKKQSAILSLLPWNVESKCLNSSLELSTPFRLLGQTPLTVGYAISQPAAKKLHEANSDLRYVADWPRSSVVFYSTLTGSVEHGDEFTVSVIDPSDERIQIWRLRGSFFKQLIGSKRAFSSRDFIDYVWHALLVPIIWKFDNFRATRILSRLT